MNNKVEHPDRRLPTRMTRSDVKEGALLSQAWLSKQSMTKSRPNLFCSFGLFNGLLLEKGESFLAQVKIRSVYLASTALSYVSEQRKEEQELSS